MNLPRQSVRLYIASVLDCTLLQYLIAEDKSNYELLYDDDEEMDTMVATIDAKSSFHRSTHVRRLVPRDHANGEARIIRHYFADNPMYTPGQFRRRFRMKRHVFIRILNTVKSVDRYFQQRENCTGLLGLSALQKVVAAIRILAYGLPADAVDEYVQIGKSTAHEALYHFCSAVIVAFGKEYIRSPTPVDVAHLLQVGENHGFPGSCNDINVLQRSPIFSAYIRGETPLVQFTVNGRTYDIYPFDRERLSDIMTACIIMHNMIVEDEKSKAINTNFDNISTPATP
ncbi:uncharacterized protein LOC101773609 [Setaria italica]|uniref:uncharacterized protein LOC101773609 n=1 Tax=Setaria italica TaxID=4555 RepID=UPI000351413E|nr:uncharacterized protein LOC101773609 [Setaria italica]